MQATVSAFDPATFSGAVLLDDGVEVPFAPSALSGTGLRLLRNFAGICARVGARA